MRNKVMLSLLVVVALGVLALGQVEPRGIIIEPPDPEGLTVSVWTDKPVYQVGEAAKIHFEINRPAYIYIWDIRPNGEVVRIFPNVYDTQTYFRAGRHTVPTPGKTYNLRVEPPLGTEWLQILAVTREFPVQLLGADPDNLEAQVLGLIPEPAEHAFDFTSFQIVDRQPPAPGTLRVRTTPSLARIYVDGVFRGWSPREIQLAPGSYDVLLRRDGYQDHTARILIQSGRTRTHTVSLTPLPVNRPPVAQFTWSPGDPEPNQWVRFDASESYDPDGRIVRYEWDFNDDGRVDATGQVAFNRFTRGGDYRVRLKVTDNDGATDELVRTVVVGVPNRPPVAQFTWSPGDPEPNQWVRFDASESYDPDGSIVRYEWDFNDDGRVDATGQVVFNRFTRGGDYRVRLKVTDNDGATDELVRTVVVGVPNRPPVAQFTWSPEDPEPNQWVRFDASESYDPDGSIVSYEWDFNDDGRVDATGQVVFNRFTRGGDYRVRLKVTDNDGATDELVRTVVVGVPNRPPVAQFTWSPEDPEPNQWVRFDASESYDPDGSIVSYEWDLNDDGRVDATGEVVFHRFARSGSYRVRLKVTDNDGATDELRRNVQVSLAAPPLPPGMPNMGTTPGIYVWGTDSWNITVNGSPLWGSPRPYQIELRTDGTFVGVSTDTSAAPLGLVPEPSEEGWRLVFEGSVQTGRVTHAFQVRDASSIWMDLRLDMTGNGVPDRSPGLVRLRQLMVNPPFNPVVVGLPEGHPGPLVPSLDFRIGSSVSYTERVRFVFWSTSIGALEAR